MKLIQRCLLVLFAATFGVVHAATTIYVDSGVADEGDGTSWETAKKTIQAAIDIAAKNDTILIAKGRYLISETLKIDSKHIELRGVTGDPADVVVDAQGSCPCLSSFTSHIIVDSITFMNGNSTDEARAGGITSDNPVLITNCIVRSCSHGHNVSGAGVLGGGIKLSTSRSPDEPTDKWTGRPYLPLIANTLVEDCIVYTEDSTSDVCGGGVYLLNHNTSGLMVRNCIARNLANKTENSVDPAQGGGAYFYHGRHENDVFLGNAIDRPSDIGGYLGVGAGVYLRGSSSAQIAVLTDSLVAENMSPGCGAGIGIGSYVAVEGCSVVSNRLSHVKARAYYQIGGAGIYVKKANHSRIANTLIAENLATNELNVAQYAGAIDAVEAQNLVISDCVVRDNVLQNAGAFSFISAGGLMVSNCVVFGNVATGEVSAIRFITNQTSPEDCAMSLIADCYIISNANLRTSYLASAGGIMQYSGAQANKEQSLGAPLIVRNCLFAGNRASKASAGWGVRASMSDNGTAVCNDLLTFDHCTFAKNKTDLNFPKFVQFTSDKSAGNVVFKGCAFWENRYWNSGSKLAYISTDYTGATFMNCYADVVNDAFTVTAENGNIGGEDAGDVKFADADAFDFRLQPGSCLIDKGGAFEHWMGTGRRKSVHDMGAGYVIGTLGRYGVTVGRRQSNPRRCGKASDIGCCELWWAPGLVMSVK